MTVLLTVVGIAVGVAVGWLLGRRVATVGGAPTGTEVTNRPADTHEIVEWHPDGVVLTNRSGRIVYRNAAARALQGTHVGVLIDEAVDEHLREARADGSSSKIIEFYGPPKVVLDLEARRLTDDTVVVYIDDISERRRIDQVRTDFVANISHELKTPIGAMSVLAETLEDETDPDTVTRVLGRLLGEAQRASRTIDDLMELSRIELGGERTVERVDVVALVAAAMDRVTELASHRGIGISNLTPVDRLSDVVVHGDRRQLVSALGNLVENAVKYSEPGGQVQIRTRRTNGLVEIGVVDQGVGIPQRDLDRIFERFYRVDRARSRATGGTGLGLSIVRHVVEQHGGAVTVESVEGEGSTFTLRLPVSADHDAADDPSAITDSTDSSEEIA